MLDGVKGLLGSKKAVIGLLLLLMNTVFVLTGRMSMPDYQAAQAILVAMYFGAETATSISAMTTKAKREAPPIQADVKVEVTDASDR